MALSVIYILIELWEPLTAAKSLVNGAISLMQKFVIIFACYLPYQERTLVLSRVSAIFFYHCVVIAVKMLDKIPFGDTL